MYKYFVFAFPIFYPSGGLRDCILKTNDIKEAINYYNQATDDNVVEIYDAEKDEIIKRKEE